MQQGAQLCFYGNFLVDGTEYPPLASRVLKSSGVVALPTAAMRMLNGAQGHLSSEGLGADPKHRSAIRPKPQRKLSRMSQPVNHTPATSNLLRDHARALGLRREISRKSEDGGRREPQCASIPRPGGRNHLAVDEGPIPSRRSGGPDRAGLAEFMSTRPALTVLLACRRACFAPFPCGDH